MSSSSFVQVEGSIALPRMLPLERIAASFGSEWALMPPHVTLRTELRALYAALLRTVCLSVDAFREACRWDRPHPISPRPAAAPVASATAYAASAAGEAGVRPAAVQVPGAKLASAGQAFPPASRVPPSHRFAGGACAIGGAALLAWIVASHTPHREPSGTAVTADTPAPSSSHREPPYIAQEAGGQRTAHADRVTADVAPRAARSAALPAPDRSPRGGLGAHALPRKFDATRMHKTPKVAVRAAHSAQGRMAGASRIEGARHGATASHHPARRIHAESAAAGRYSPRQTSARQDDDWASIVTYAKTHAAPRAAGRSPVPVDSTEWVNHVAHRRVTEIPDRFAK